MGRSMAPNVWYSDSELYVETGQEPRMQQTPPGPRRRVGRRGLESSEGFLPAPAVTSGPPGT